MNVIPLGYFKVKTVREKFYLAKIGVGMPAKIRLLTKKFRTASEAEAYARRFCARCQHE